MSARFSVFPHSGGGFRSRNHSARDISVPGRAPAPTYRHAAPSGPWPWMDFDADFPVVESPVSVPGVDGKRWMGYPQNLFGNWTPDQVRRSKMLSGCSQSDVCWVHKVDVFDDGGFEENVEDQTAEVVTDRAEEFWDRVNVPRPENIRIRALFVDNMTEPVLQILGTRYVVEPFFFSSSMNWIPSRYQEEVKPGEGDHITITLPFIRTMQNPRTRPPSLASAAASFRHVQLTRLPLPFGEEHQVIDTQAPLILRSTNNILLQDLLAIHMVRNTKSSTIISYHPSSSLRRTSAKRLHSLIRRTGESVYWSKIFASSRDPTFLFLCFLWYALYAWDEAFEVLYAHINWLESRVLSTNDIHLTRELHILQAHLLHYQSLLQDFRKSVVFVQTTPNPAMGDPSVTDAERQTSADLLQKETGNLLSEIDRLEGQRNMQSNRLKNVMDLAFATVNIDDSRHMKRLTQATVRDSAAMKQISYLTMVFLPASLIAGVFGMNVKEINQGTNETLAHYIEATLALMLFTAWLVIALQTHSNFHPKGCSVWRRVGWPIFYASERIAAKKMRFGKRI
ncbi:hypothetical protein F5I97DRAFT_7352 [Phlebopus sp. FC_14]|nr:hypothetical protein F5I97DRAFT_7352 [Phlebopus sp. FC_14]